MGDLIPFRRRKPKPPRWTRPEDYGAAPSPKVRAPSRIAGFWRTAWPPLTLVAAVALWVLYRNGLLF